MTQVFRVVKTKHETCSHGDRHTIDYVEVVTLRQVGHQFNSDGPARMVMQPLMEDAYGRRYERMSTRDARTVYRRETGGNYTTELSNASRRLDGTAITEGLPDGEALMWDDITGFYFLSEMSGVDDGYTGRHRRAS